MFGKFFIGIFDQKCYLNERMYISQFFPFVFCYIF